MIILITCVEYHLIYTKHLGPVILSGSIIKDARQESVDHVYCHVGWLVTKSESYKIRIQTKQKIIITSPFLERMLDYRTKDIM